MLEAHAKRYLPVPSDLKDFRSTLESRLTPAPATVLQVVYHNLTQIEQTSTVDDIGAYMNGFLDPVISHAQGHDGMVSQAIYRESTQVVFGASPFVSPEHHARNAVKAALAIREAIQQTNAAKEAEGKPTLAASIVMQSGEVLHGDIVVPEAIRYIHVGRPIHTCRQLADLTQQDGEILIGDETEKYVRDLVELQKAFTFTPQNQDIPVTVYRVIGLKQLQE